jgi:PAS domain S-box-containing protein
VSNLAFRSSPPPARVLRPARTQPDVRLFRSIAELVDAGIWVADRAGVTVFANRRMAGLLAIDAPRLTASRVWELLGVDSAQRLAGAMPAEHDVRFIRPDGRAVRLHISTTPWLIAGERVGSIAICVDVDSVATPAADAPPQREELLGWSRLSRREREVLADIAQGDRVPLIATRLFISQSTVRNHLSSAFRKLNVSDQQELVALLRRHDQRYMPEPTPGS